ncbi:hypothetical protein Btru_076349 [Bulinus truncatus]|nr:hypothetical protein Btru_076349 [Bulinus truncatus]
MCEGHITTASVDMYEVISQLLQLTCTGVINHSVDMYEGHVTAASVDMYEGHITTASVDMNEGHVTTASLLQLTCRGYVPLAWSMYEGHICASVDMYEGHKLPQLTCTRVISQLPQ